MAICERRMIFYRPCKYIFRQIINLSSNLFPGRLSLPYYIRIKELYICLALSFINEKQINKTFFFFIENVERLRLYWILQPGKRMFFVLFLDIFEYSLANLVASLVGCKSRPSYKKRIFILKRWLWICFKKPIPYRYLCIIGNVFENLYTQSHLLFIYYFLHKKENKIFSLSFCII